MSTELRSIGGVEVEVTRKAIKNLHVGVYPPNGRVRVAAPMAVSEDAIQRAVLTRLSWIRKKQSEFASQERQAPRRYVSGETHWVLGTPMRLSVVEAEGKRHSIVKASRDRLELRAPEGSDTAARKQWMEDWRRSELRRVAAPKVEYWRRELGVQPASLVVRSMRTKWGSCNAEKGLIWLNTELVGKPIKSIDYVILHELAHFRSGRHDAVFLAILDNHMPDWRQVRAELNALPLIAWGETDAND